MPISVACAQIAPLKAQVGKNLDRQAEIILQAAAESVDLLVFPEASTTGYFLEGGVLEGSLSGDELLSQLQLRLTGKMVRPIDVVVGFYERSGGQLYNAAAYLELRPDGGRIVHIYRKFFLATYGVFDEERFITRSHDLGVFDTRFGRLAILICEDVWHSILPTLSAVAGAQMILVPTASPARGFGGSQIENLDRYERLLRSISEEHSVYCVNAQLCGFEGGKGFVGGSMVIDPMGNMVSHSPISEEHLLIAPVDLDLVAIARAQSPLISDLETAWEDIRRLAGTVMQTSDT